MSDRKTAQFPSGQSKRFKQSGRWEWNVGIAFGILAIVFAATVIVYGIRFGVSKHENMKRQAYRDSTRQLSDRLVFGVGNLTEWSTDESLESYSDAIRIMAERKDVNDELVDELLARVKVLKEMRQVRQIRFEALLAGVDDFPAISDVKAVDAFDKRVQEAVYTLSKSQGLELLQKWVVRRKDIVALVANPEELKRWQAER